MENYVEIFESIDMVSTRLGEPPITENIRYKIVVGIESVLFRLTDVDPEFRRLGDLYILRGILLGRPF